MDGGQWAVDGCLERNAAKAVQLSSCTKDVRLPSAGQALLLRMVERARRTGEARARKGLLKSSENVEQRHQQSPRTIPQKGCVTVTRDHV